mgnify:CR=1 FL=1
MICGEMQIKLRDRYQFIWQMSILSTLLGIAIVSISNHPIGEYGILLLGIAHGVVFIPTMITDKCTTWKMVVGSIVCITYPFWGLAVGMMVCSIMSPFFESFVWGLVVAWVLNRPLAILVFLIVGVLSNISLFVIIRFNLGHTFDEWGIAQTIGVWYVIVLPVFPIIVRYLPKSKAMTNPFECVHCSYSLVGLLNYSLCPECGNHPHEKSDPQAALENLVDSD